MAASGNSADMPSERKEEALNMAKIWDNFLTNDLSGSGHGLATVSSILLRIRITGILQKIMLQVQI